ncbi:MAG: FTR1 family protein [Halioglobus sp.]
MLLNSVILLLREVLEAAVLISVLMALSRNLSLGWRWLYMALPLAALLIWLVASMLGVITDALDGTGQEVVNATLQLLIFLMVLSMVGFSAGYPVISSSTGRILRVLMAGAVVCALIREGTEIYVYIAGFAVSEDFRTAVFTGSAIGAGIGVSLGVLLYAALRGLDGERGYIAGIILLCLIGAGMMIQATLLLEQVDWLPMGQPVWDSSQLIDEQSVAGELLYAVFGYESTPGSIQVVAYLLSIAAVVAAYFCGKAYWSSHETG